MFDLGAPDGYGATIWNNVIDADVYYQTRGNQGGLAALFTADPEGRPISGAYNRHLDGTEELPAGNPYGAFSTDSDHLYAWHTFYTATVTGSLPVGADPPADASFDFSQTGWAHSIHNADRVPLPLLNFYGNDQDHEHSETILVDGDGDPHEAGLAELGLTADQIRDARWAPENRPGDVVNGDFEAGAGSGLIAGWSHHGGGGDGDVVSENVGPNENRFLRLDVNNRDRTHNFMVVPASANFLLFDARAPAPSSDDRLEISLGGILVGSFGPASTGAWSVGLLAVPPFPPLLPNVVDTLTVAIAPGSDGVVSATIDVDNLRFAFFSLPGDYNEDGVVNAADYVVWRNSNGKTGLGLAADGNVDGVVDVDDYQWWRSYFGERLDSAATASVPEAGPTALLGVALLYCLSVRPGTARRNHPSAGLQSAYSLIFQLSTARNK
jgi:hypothetical protein